MPEARDLPRPIFLGLACALPLALFAIHRELGHAGDLGFFHEWYLALREGSAFYRDGPGLNYPIVGVLLVCGPRASSRPCSARSTSRRSCSCTRSRWPAARRP
ncbi:MAG: hypothetical protein M5U28_43105 [Sandaracinaceae bacterium]|nr:hypothetical protein [Sandaracinaceae bacterium]